jgi:hypothetical protein
MRDPDDKAAVAVVGTGATVCVSAAATTYAFDTVAREWSRAGDWVLPFHDEAAHVRDLGLWIACRLAVVASTTTCHKKSTGWTRPCGT